MRALLLCGFLLFLHGRVAGQVFANASFSLRDSTGQVAGWICQEGYVPENKKLKKSGIIKWDTIQAHSAPGCVMIYNQSDVISNCRQTAPMVAGGVKTFRLHFLLRTESRRGFADAWITLKDDKGGFVRKEALPLQVYGKTAWKPYSIDITSTSDVAYAEAGLQFTGPGKAWFDDVRIEEVQGPAPPKRQVSTVAENYLREVIDIIRTQSFYADSVNLDEVYRHALELIPGAETAGDAYPGVAYILERTGDPRSQFYDPATTRNWWKEQKINDVEVHYPTATLTPDNFVLVWLPGVTTMKREILERYADTLHRQLLAIKPSKIKGWILDLRENVGGNATAMLAAIGPLLPPGVQGHYLRSSGKVPWLYQDGAATIDTLTIRVKKEYKMKKSGQPIAVLTDDQTYGAGELIAVAFKGRKGSRFFGERTSGATHNEKRINLSDKAMLFLTAGIMEDVNGNRYNGKIIPDMHIRHIYKTDVCMQEAVKWLKQQK